MSGLKVHPGQRICTLIEFVDGEPVVRSISMVTGTHAFGFDAEGLLHFEGTVTDVSEVEGYRETLPSKSEQKRRAIRREPPIECPVCAVQQRPVDHDGDAR